jgi:hypothetical protein
MSLEGHAGLVSGFDAADRPVADAGRLEVGVERLHG